jgi:hypothetical protein
MYLELDPVIAPRRKGKPSNKPLFCDQIAEFTRFRQADTSHDSKSAESSDLIQLNGQCDCVTVRPLAWANWCGFGLQKACNKICMAFFEAIPLRNVGRRTFCLFLNSITNIKIKLWLGPAMARNSGGHGNVDLA